MKKCAIIILLLANYFSLYGSLYSQPINIERYLPANHVKDGSVDYTSYLQRGLDENINVQFPDFPILVNENGLNLRSNHRLNFAKNSALLMKPNDKERYGLLNLLNVADIVINNPTLIGDRDRHIGSTGEWGMGINIQSSKNVTVNNPNISKFWGDGIYIGELFHDVRNRYRLKSYYSENIKVIGGKLDSNRRNGISVISVKDLLISGVTIKNTEGTLPMAGIDIEPNNNEQFLENILIRDVITENNAEVGIKYVVSNYFGARERTVSITIENCMDKGSKVALFLGGSRNTSHYKGNVRKFDGHITIKNFKAESNVTPVRVGSIQKYNPIINFDTFSIYENGAKSPSKEKALRSELTKKKLNIK